MTTTAAKRKSIPGGECPFGAKKVKVETEQNGEVVPQEKKIKKPKVKKTAGQQNGTGAKQKTGGKKGKEERDDANDVEAMEDASGAPSNKVVENFRQKLTKGAVTIDTIRHFTSGIQENPSLAVDFVRAGGTFKPLLKILDSMDKEKVANIASLLELIHYILIESVNYDEVHADYARKCATKIFTEYKPVILSLLKRQYDRQLLMAGFRILKAILLVDYSLGREILQLLDICLPEMEVGKYRDSSGTQESLRGVFVEFNLSFLIDTSSELVRAWLSRFQLLSPLLTNLVYDRAENVILVMKTFQQYILESHEIDKFIFRTTFNTDILKALVNVYEWVGPAKEEVDIQTKNTVLNTAEKVILPLLTSKKYHLVPKVVDLGKGNSRHKHILLALKNSQLHKHQKKLALKIFEVCPGALPAVLENFGTLLKTQKEECQEFLLDILRQPNPEEVTKQFTAANAKQVSNFVTKSTLPRTVLEFITTSINRKDATAYCLEYLAVMLNQCEKYLQEIPKLKNLDQFDLKKVKFDVINQILALFPTIDAIMSAMMYHRSDKTVAKPYIAMEHAMDILLACIRTFPSYIESSSFITTYRNILDPVYRHRAVEYEYLPYEFKAIKVVIALEPQSIAFNSELFPSVLKLLSKVYLNGSPEMQREATTLLLALFRNTNLFGNNPTEIEIWFQSLYHTDPLIVPQLVSFLAFSFRQAAERQGLSVEKDHSLVNEAFEKVRRSDLDEMFERVEAEAAGQLEQEETVELPVADNFLIYMFNPGTNRPKQFHTYLEAVALRYFHMLPHPEIVENCAKNVDGKLKEYFSKWIVEGKLKPLDGFGEESSLGQLSNVLLKKEKNMQAVLSEGPSHRCELVYLIHETIFYATRLIELGKFDSSYSTVCSFYLNNFLELLLAEEVDLKADEQKLGEVLENIFCHRPVLYQHFTIADKKSDCATVVTNFIYELMKKLQSVPSFSHYTMLYSNKIVNEIISSSTGKSSFELNSALMEKLLEIFELNERHCVSLLKHYSKLSHRSFINEKNEKTYHYNLLTVGLQKLAGNRDHFLDRETIGRLSQIYVDFIRENGNELNLESLEVGLLRYLDTFSHSIGHLGEDLFQCFFESKRIGKPMVKLAAFLLGRDARLSSVFLELVQGNVAKKELVYPLMNVAFAKGVFVGDSESIKKILNVVYNEFKSGLSKTIEKPGKAAVIYKENSIANQQLIRMCMPKNECVDFAKKKLKIDSLEVYQLKLMMEIYRKAFDSTKDDAGQVKVVYVNVFNVLLQFYNILLKVGDLLKEVNKLNELILETFSWVQLGKTCKHLKDMEFKEITDTANWTNFCKFSLKLGIDIQKSPDHPNRHDERLHVLLKIVAVLVDLFYKDASSPPDVATFYELTLSHSRFLDVLLVSFQFKIKTSLVHLLLTCARKNPSVMDKKHVPLLLGAYGATLTESNRYTLALIQLYERSGVHIHEYRPFLWGEAAIRHFSLGQDSNDKQTLFRINNSEVFNLLNKEKLLNTLHSFPIWRKMDAGAQLPEVTFDDLRNDQTNISGYQATTEIERFVENRYIKDKKPAHEMLYNCAGKREVLAAIYDPAFLVPMLGYLFAPEASDLLDVAGRNGALALPFVCLASEDEVMRLAAASVIVRIKGHLELSRKFIDSKFWLHLFTAVQNGLATLGKIKPPGQDQPAAAATKKTPSKPAFLPTLFIGETVNLLSDILNELHSTLTHYFLLKDTFDFKAVPNFLVMFHSSEVKHNNHRIFILETLYYGLKTHDDFMILRHSPVIRALLDFYGSSLSNRDLNILILNTLNSIAKIPKSCEVMVNSVGFLTWLSEWIEGIESFHFDTIEAFLGIISNVWYSAQIQQQSYNMKQLSRSVLIMVLKFLPLLSTRSSSKTLTRFLNLLEKTTTENERNMELVSEEVLELMLAYFEKLFEQQMWYVNYVRTNGSENSEDCQPLGEKMMAQGMEQSTIYVVLTLRRFAIRWQKAQMDSFRRIRPFELMADRSRLPIEWEKWKRELQRYFDATGVTSQWEKRSIMLHLVGSDVQEIFEHLPGVNEVPHIVTDPPYFDVAIKRLDEHFEPLRRRNYERHLFRQICQNQEERFADFVLRLRIQAKRCEFDRYDSRETEDRIIEQIVEACRSTELKRQILEKDMTLDEILTLGTTLADVQRQVREMDGQKTDNTALSNVSKVSRVSPREMRNEVRGPQRRNFDRQFDRACFACGRRGHLKGDSACRARNAKCLKCGETGHFINRCLKRINTSRPVIGPPPPKRIRCVNEDDKEAADKANVFFAMGRNSFEFIVGGVRIPMIIDSGADANVIDEATWSKAKEVGMKVADFSEQVDRKLVAYATKQPMKMKGMFRAEIQAGSNVVQAKFYVVEQGKYNLLGDSTAKELKVLQVGFDIGSVNSLKQIPFPKIKGILVEIPIDKSVQPVQQTYRRAPIALEDKIYDKLKDLLRMDIVEKVNGPSPWVSPVVPILKRSGELRLCVDMRRANQAVLRETHPLPVIEELLASVEGAVKFSKLDVKEAYHQLEISEDSRVITTFITKYGLFRYKRLMFGISCAPELFQKVMDTIVAGLEGIVVYLDDCLVSGRTQEEHDSRLNALLNRFKEYGVLLNWDKCVFNVERLECLGHELSTFGVKPMESRVLAVQQFREPVNLAELRSFLGLITYVGRFIPHLATKTDPLRDLLRGGKKFHWADSHQTAFDEIKRAVVNVKHLGFFSPRDTTILVADASPTGLGAVLIQQDSKGDRRIISYASKALTDLERKYFQTEREALALVWAVDRFKLYLQGTKFKLVTDCKPLQFLFSPRSKPCMRIERWVLRLQSYSYEIVHEPGATNLADALSRLSVTEPKAFDMEGEDNIGFLTNTVTPTAVTVQEIRDETQKDDIFKEVFEALDNGNWTEKAKCYKPYASELCCSSNILLRGERIVVPASLQPKVLELAHEGHPGMVVMKRRLRQKVWWPSMDKEVEAFVKRCKDCTLVSCLGPPEPLIQTQMPSKPWCHIAVDFMGPLPSGHNLLVLVDYFSRFVEVVVMRETTAKLTIQALHETFCRYGIPESLKSDNGPQFVSEALAQFCKDFGIQLRKSTPYWPQANGEVERANRALKKRLQISQENPDSDWKWDLRMYLLMYNSTPHSTTGVAPSALMFGRVLRDKLPSFPGIGLKSMEETRDKDQERKLKQGEYADKRRRAEPNLLNEGDVVVAKRMVKDNKLASNFGPEEFVIMNRNGSDVLLKSTESGKTIHRNVSHLKPVVRNPDDEESSNVGMENKPTAIQELPGNDRQDGSFTEQQRPKRDVKRPSYLQDFELARVQHY